MYLTSNAAGKKEGAHSLMDVLVLAQAGGRADRVLPGLPVTPSLD